MARPNTELFTLVDEWKRSDKAASDSERVAQIMCSFYNALEDLDDFTRQQLTLIYARKILKLGV